MRNGFTLLELMVTVILASIVVALAAPLFRPLKGCSRTVSCVNNLSQLWKMLHNYMVQYGGCSKSMPDQTGGEFWLCLARCDPRLIDDSLRDIYRCPVRGQPLSVDETDYRGPAQNVNTLSDGDIVGADREDNHGRRAGGNLIRKSGDVLCVPDNDPLWRRARRQTVP